MERRYDQLLNTENITICECWIKPLFLNPEERSRMKRERNIKMNLGFTEKETVLF